MKDHCVKIRPPKKEISILLPAYNEAWRISNCIQTVESFVRHHWSSYEIIISEDGSTDATESIVMTMSRENPNLVFLHSKSRLGKGKAIKRALDVAKGDVVVFMDVDLATDLRCLPHIVNLVKASRGLAIGSRYANGSRVKRPISRTMFSLGYNIFVRALFFDGIHDHQCGFKAMSQEFAKASKQMISSDGWFFDTELILSCKRRGFPLHEIGVEWTETRKVTESSIKLFRDASQMGIDLLRFKLSRA
jgi:glycosyltransferase involved in cell wall biosynthesis